MILTGLFATIIFGYHVYGINENVHKIKETIEYFTTPRINNDFQKPEKIMIEEKKIQDNTDPQQEETNASQTAKAQSASLLWY